MNTYIEIVETTRYNGLSGSKGRNKSKVLQIFTGKHLIKLVPSRDNNDIVLKDELLSIEAFRNSLVFDLTSDIVSYYNCGLYWEEVYEALFDIHNYLGFK